MEELISVIIPTYKRYDLIDRAIKSVLNQTYKNIEIIVVDDNIKESIERKETEKILKKYPQVKYIKNEKNLGGGLTRNVGIKSAKADLIAFLDDDDEFLPTKIEKQYKLYKSLDNNNIAIIYCYKNDYYEDGRFAATYKRDFEGCPLYEHMLYFTTTTSCWFCNKKALKKVGMFDNISSQQDATLLLKLLGAGYEIYRVPEVLVNWYIHDNNSGITTVSNKYISAVKNYRDECRKYYYKLSNKEKTNVEYKFLNQICNLYIKNGDKKNAYIELKKMIKLKTLNIKNIKNIIKIIIS